MLPHAKLIQNLRQQLTRLQISPRYSALLNERILSDEADTLALLPSIMCHALGGTHEQALPLATVWHLLRHAGRILDDFQDGERQLDDTEARADLNASTGYLFAIGRILATLETCDVSPTTANDIRMRIYDEGLYICGGQHDDLTIRYPTLEQSWEIAEAKTGAFCRVACWSGARLVTADVDTLDRVSQIGFAIGMLSQIYDDVSDLFSANGGDFVLNQAGSLAISYARAILPPNENVWFSQLLTMSEDDESAREQAREMIVHCGAILYLAVQSRQYHQQAVEQLEKLQLPLSNSERLKALLDKLCFYDDI